MGWTDWETDLTNWEPASRAEHATFYALVAVALLPWLAGAAALVWRFAR